jgi:hypothetical protein
MYLQTAVLCGVGVCLCATAGLSTQQPAVQHAAVGPTLSRRLPLPACHRATRTRAALRRMPPPSRLSPFSSICRRGLPALADQCGCSPPHEMRGGPRVRTRDGGAGGVAGADVYWAGGLGEL